MAVYDTVELTAEIAATYDNPFDPDQIAVEARVTTPEGKVLSVPGFFYAPMRLARRAFPYARHRRSHQHRSPPVSVDECPLNGRTRLNLAPEHRRRA